MQFLYPIGLFALAGIAVPLLIHLWNIKPGRRLKIGSIALLGEGSDQRSRSFRLRDWLLLLLRCLLLIFLGLILAGPYLDKKMEKDGPKGWVLVRKENLKLIYHQKTKEIDSLLSSGYQVREFAPGFPQLKLKDTLVLEAPLKINKLNYFSLLRELNEQLPAGFPLQLYADRQLSKLSGSLPELALKLQWNTIEKKDSLSSWKTSFAGKTYLASSGPSSTSYKVLDQGEGTARMLVLIQGTANQADQHYLKAALKSIGEYSGLKIQVDGYNEKNFSLLKPDLVFWLSDREPDQALRKAWKKGAVLLSYEQGQTLALQSSIHLNPDERGNQDAVLLHKRISPVVVKGRTVWTDGFGQPLLSLDEDQALQHYRFYSRFNPQWTDLVWREEFLKALMPLLFAADDQARSTGFEQHPDDQRVQPEALPLSLPGNQYGIEQRRGWKEPLNLVFWGLAFSVFVLERILSLKAAKG
ncbi:BatA domain-containing protein [Pedobacter nutrimenti]|uniref:BatA domain-containing protein n=1 Tax=Pedobacter nutrimenti TaxID=1241337 RepID=UPI000DA1679D|nr:BatA domain-containing protein [Pedobacter nutrimenti]